MIKILREGYVKDKWIGECSNCSAILECRTGDIKGEIGADRSGVKYSYINCAYCNKDASVCVYIEGSTVYKKIRKKIESREIKC